MWEFDSTSGNYYIWRKKTAPEHRAFGAYIWITTKTCEPPSRDSGGYFNKNEMLKLKGISAT